MSHVVVSQEIVAGNGREIPELPPSIAPGEPAAVAIQAALSRGVVRLRAASPAALEGDAEGVHRMRTTTRRLRSELRTFRSLLVPDWAKPLEEELKWLGGMLGAVRDLDVLKERLGEAAGATRDALGPLFRRLDDRHASASEALRESLGSERYQDLLTRLDVAMCHPMLKDDAWESCRDAMPPLVSDAWNTLKRHGRALGPDDPDENFHEVRKLAKRARYAAEAVSDTLDEPLAKQAKHFAKLATELQDTLGEHQDAIVAGQEIERAVADYPDDGPFNFAAGRLLERQHLAADQSRAEFFEVWDRLDRKKNRHWLKT